MDDLVNKTAEVTAAPIENEVLGEANEMAATEPFGTAELGAQPSVESQNLQPAGERSPLVMPDVQPKAEPVIAEALNGTEESGPKAPELTSSGGKVPAAEVGPANTLETTPAIDIKHLLAEVGDGSADKAMGVESEITKLREEAGVSTPQ